MSYNTADRWWQASRSTDFTVNPSENKHIVGTVTLNGWIVTNDTSRRELTTHKGLGHQTSGAPGPQTILLLTKTDRMPILDREPDRVGCYRRCAAPT